VDRRPLLQVAWRRLFVALAWHRSGIGDGGLGCGGRGDAGGGHHHSPSYVFLALVTPLY
jgi:hypothetical protein